MGILIIAVMVILSTCYITASMNTRHAQNFHAAAVAEIEASHFSNAVIAEVTEKAEDNGFTSLDVDVLENMDMAEVTLVYDYTIPFLNVLLNHEIVGYAR